MIAAGQVAKRTTLSKPAPLLIYDRGTSRIWHREFRLPTHGRLIVEYAGMPDVPDYMDGIRHKERVHRANRVKAVLLYPSALQGYKWQQRVREKIEEASGSHYQQTR